VSRSREASVRAARAGLLRRVGRSALCLALAVALLIGLTAVLTPIFALLFAPWAIDWGGGPTLTGAWVGPLRSNWGSEYHLYVELGWEPPRGRTSRAYLTGTAWVCNRTGAEFRLEVRGDADRAAQDWTWTWRRAPAGTASRCRCAVPGTATRSGSPRSRAPSGRRASCAAAVPR